MTNVQSKSNEVQYSKPWPGFEVINFLKRE